MTREERNKRRALIVRRWAAYRTGRAQREIWRRRKAVAASQSEDLDEDVAGNADALLEELPDGLIG
jgi:hypothetical protein